MSKASFESAKLADYERFPLSIFKKRYTRDALIKNSANLRRSKKLNTVYFYPTKKQERNVLPYCYKAPPPSCNQPGKKRVFMSVKF